MDVNMCIYILQVFARKMMLHKFCGPMHKPDNPQQD